MVRDGSSGGQSLKEFNKNLRLTQTRGDVRQHLAHFLQSRGCTDAALVGLDVPIDKMTIVEVYLGSPTLWQAYAVLVETNPDPLVRALRICPHPVSISDILNHRRLAHRLAAQVALLEQHGTGDVLLVPLFADGGRQHVFALAAPAAFRQRAARHALTLACTLAGLRSLRMRSTPDQVLAGELTPRQREIAAWVVAGKSDWEIGTILQISHKTVNYHVENIKRVYGVRSRSQFIAAIVRDGGLPS